VAIFLAPQSPEPDPAASPTPEHAGGINTVVFTHDGRLVASAAVTRGEVNSPLRASSEGRKNSLRILQ
jgi:hypothetical protein